MVFTEHERDIALRLFSRIAEETRDGIGVTRESYGPGEGRAWGLVAEVAREQHLNVAPDHADNLLMTAFPLDEMGEDPVTVVGSHLDSVPCGGNYDGLAGVIAALLIVKKARETGFKRPLLGVGFRGEESAWFGVPHLGAKAFLGQLTEGELALLGRDGTPLRDHMVSCGAKIDLVQSEQSAVHPRYVWEYWELHIEQGPILVDRRTPIGVVTNIRGHARTTTARVFGQAAHSGTTPHYLRKDAVMRFAEFVQALKERHLDMVGEGHDLMWTVGQVHTNAKYDSPTAVAGEVRFSLDARSSSVVTLEDFIGIAMRKGGDNIDLGDVWRSRPCPLDENRVTRLRRAADALAVRYYAMPSGAGHDASVFTWAGIPSGMVFVRNEGGSHNPHERMEMDDFMLGVEVLWHAITKS